MDAAVVPVKDPARAKLRLSERMDTSDRVDLAYAMLDDVLALAGSAPFFEWIFVSDSADVRARVAGAGFRAEADNGSGLNDAIRVGISAALRAGAESVTVVPSDTPLVFAGDLQDILDTGATSDVVVVPANDGGTNALFLSPPDVIAPAFGTGSLRAHMHAAEQARVRCALLPLDRFALDIDRPADIDAYLAARKFAPSRTQEVLERLTGSGSV